MSDWRDKPFFRPNEKDDLKKHCQGNLGRLERQDKYYVCEGCTFPTARTQNGFIDHAWTRAPLWLGWHFKPAQLSHEELGTALRRNKAMVKAVDEEIEKCAKLGDIGATSKAIDLTLSSDEERSPASESAPARSDRASRPGPSSAGVLARSGPWRGDPRPSQSRTERSDRPSSQADMETQITTLPHGEGLPQSQSSQHLDLDTMASLDFENVFARPAIPVMGFYRVQDAKNLLRSFGSEIKRYNKRGDKLLCPSPCEDVACVPGEHGYAEHAMSCPYAWIRLRVLPRALSKSQRDVAKKKCSEAFNLYQAHIGTSDVVEIPVPSAKPRSRGSRTDKHSVASGSLLAGSKVRKRVSGSRPASSVASRIDRVLTPASDLMTRPRGTSNAAHPIGYAASASRGMARSPYALSGYPSNASIDGATGMATMDQSGQYPSSHMQMQEMGDQAHSLQTNNSFVPSPYLASPSNAAYDFMPILPLVQTARTEYHYGGDAPMALSLNPTWLTNVGDASLNPSSDAIGSRGSNAYQMSHMSGGQYPQLPAGPSSNARQDTIQDVIPRGFQSNSMDNGFGPYVRSQLNEPVFSPRGSESNTNWPTDTNNSFADTHANNVGTINDMVWPGHMAATNAVYAFVESGYPVSERHWDRSIGAQSGLANQNNDPAPSNVPSQGTGSQGNFHQNYWDGN